MQLVDQLLAELRGATNYSAPAGIRVPAGNLQDNPDQQGVSLSAVQAISRGLTVSYDLVRYYEQALLQVQKDLYEGEDLRARLQTEMHRVDELSSVISNQDAHVQDTEAARINAEQASRVWTDHLQETIADKESLIRDLTTQLDKKKEEVKKLQEMMETRDRELTSEISDLAVDRQEAIVRHQFACESYSAEITALKAEDTRVREQLREAYSQRDDYKTLADQLAKEYPAREVSIVYFVAMKNQPASLKAEHLRCIQHLEQTQDATRRFKSQLGETRQRCVALELEKTELELRLGYLTGAVAKTAHSWMIRELTRKSLKLSSGRKLIGADAKAIALGGVMLMLRLLGQLEHSLHPATASCLSALARHLRGHHPPFVMNWMTRTRRSSE